MTTRTIKEREALRQELSKKWKRWLLASDEELLAEAKQTWPNIESATRDELLKYLTLEHVDRMV